MNWYEYSQNNSGGSFDVNDKVCHRLYIQAETAEQANAKAEELECYWDGCASDMDCPCCGDRWYRNYDDAGVDTNGKSIIDYVQELCDNYGWTVPDARLFYDNGKVTELFSKRKLA